MKAMAAMAAMAAAILTHEAFLAHGVDVGRGLGFEQV